MPQYDVFFTLQSWANISVTAKTKEKAEEKVQNLSTDELLERMRSAIENGIEITLVENAD